MVMLIVVAAIVAVVIVVKVLVWAAAIIDIGVEVLADANVNVFKSPMTAFGVPNPLRECSC